MGRRKGDLVRVGFRKEMKGLSVWGRENREDRRIRNDVFSFGIGRSEYIGNRYSKGCIYRYGRGVSYRLWGVSLVVKGHVGEWKGRRKRIWKGVYGLERVWSFLVKRQLFTSKS